MISVFILNPLIIWNNWDEQDTYYELIDSGKLTTAEGLEITRRCFDNGNCYYVAQYSYQADNRDYFVNYEYLFEDVYERTYQNARSASVLYLLEEPSKSILKDNRVEGSSPDQSMVFLALWSIFLGFIWKPRKYYKNKSTKEKNFFTARIAIRYWVLLELILLARVSQSEHREFPDTPIILALVVLPALIALPWAEFWHLFRAIMNKVRIRSYLYELSLEAIFLLYLGLFFIGLIFVDWKNMTLAILYFTVAAILAGVPDAFQYWRRKGFRK